MACSQTDFKGTRILYRRLPLNDTVHRMGQDVAQTLVYRFIRVHLGVLYTSTASGSWSNKDLGHFLDKVLLKPPYIVALQT